MAAGSRDSPTNAWQWGIYDNGNQFIRYFLQVQIVMTLRKCISLRSLDPSTVIIPVVPATDNAPAVPEQTTVEKIFNLDYVS
ncbi:hypothetical protein Tco_1226116 [Tanacetum coccineum]